MPQLVTSRILLSAAILLIELTGPATAAPAKPPAPPDGAKGMKRYDSPYYDVASDLESEKVKEAILRMTRMAEEYHDRTRDFSGQIRGKMPFLLFSKPEDYYQAGGPPGSAGVFMSYGGASRLMAISSARSGGFTWHVVQHEGFHQFAHHVIGGRLPPWVNEGLAEYFGEGVYTGDGFVTGLLPASRLRRVQFEIKTNRLRSIHQMMAVSHMQWNMEMNILNYDHAWSMVHFLAHAENEKYRAPFTKFIKDLGAGRPYAKAWEDNFGSTEGFEQKWRDWWLALEPTATRDLYVKAAAAALTSFYGRAVAQKQTFDKFEEFIAAGRDGSLKVPTNDDWLPPGLFKYASGLADAVRDEVKFELGKNPASPQILATMKDQTLVTSTYNPANKTKRVTVEIDDMAPVLERARKLIDEKKKDEARQLLMDRIRKLPRSPKIEEARKMAQSTFQK